MLIGNIDELSIFYEDRKERLKVQLPVFLARSKCCSIFEIVEAVKQMSSEVRSIGRKIFSLTRLFLVMPVTVSVNARNLLALSSG